jgi:ATP-dependent DNA helicase RecG
MVHPDRVVDEAGLARLPLVEPVYPLTEGLSLNQVRKAIDGALARLPELPEWQDPAWLQREGYPTFADALRTLHRPSAPSDVRPDSRAWLRLAYDGWPGNWRWRWYALMRRPAGRARLGPAPCATAHRCTALFADDVTIARGGDTLPTCQA